MKYHMKKYLDIYWAHDLKKVQLIAVGNGIGNCKGTRGLSFVEFKKQHENNPEDVCQHCVTYMNQVQKTVKLIEARFSV